MNIETKAHPIEISKKQVQHLLQELESARAGIAGKTIAAGFDGFIDTLVQVIKMKLAGQAPELFSTIASFGQYIVEKQGASLSLEMLEKNVKLGGNMPIMANALAQLGASVHCIGAFGYPHLHPVFETFSAGCKLYSFANPGYTTALEFNDGKIMMGNMGELNAAGWTQIIEKIGIEKIKSIYQQSELICVLNWSEIDASTNIWNGLLNDIVKKDTGTSKTKSIFFDLSDCSKRTDDLIKEAIDLLQKFSKHTKVLLSLNKNEAGLIHKVLLPGSIPGDNMKELSEILFNQLGIDVLILHSSKESVVYDQSGSFYCKTFYVDNPKISTGAGDNFNAGFCVGHLLNLAPDQSLILANAVSGYYVRNGSSATWHDLITFLKTQQA